MDVLATLREALTGRYDVEGEAGRGGMATVYAARDLKHQRRVAIKVLRPDLAATLGPERFLREIETAARLQHPHILPVYDSGEAAGALYFVMPFVEGESLRQRMEREGQLPLDDALRITAQVAEGLAFAHAQNVVHRDIKPENILLSAGTAVIADFGIARAISAAAGSRLTSTGMAFGTPDYMSPEQSTGDTVDGRADQYSLGCVLYEMLAGSPPFHGATAQILRARHTLDPAPSLRSARPNLSPALDAVVQRTLAKMPADRFPSIRAFLDALTGAASGALTAGGIAAPPKSGRLVLAAGGAALLVLGALGAVLAARWLGGRAGVGAPEGRPRLAVLPFESLGRPEDKYVADGMSDEITSRVAGMSGLTVIARSSAVPSARAGRNQRDIGHELGVSYLLVGSVQTDRRPDGTGSVRVIPHLIRVADSADIWSDRYDAALAPGELLAVQSIIADSVAKKLKVSLLLPEQLALAARPTDNLVAYESFLRGNIFAGQTYAEGPSRQAVDMFQRAVDADPRFALAWAKLSQAQTRYYFNFDRAPARLTQARTAVDRALAIDSTLPEARLALGLVHYLGDFDYDRAEREFEAVRRDRPNNSEVLSYLASIQRRRGRFAEAITSLRRAVELDPRSQLYALELATSYLMLRRFPEAESELDRAVALAPDWLAAHITRSFLQWTWKGDLEGARAAMREALKTHSMRELLTYVLPFNPQYVSTLGGEFQDSLEALGAKDVTVDPGLLYLAKGLSLNRRGDNRATVYFDSARAVWEPRAQARPQEWTFHARLGLSLAGLGRREEALREGRSAVELLPLSKDAQGGTYPLSNMVTIAILIGELDTALVYLGPLLEHPSQFSPNLLRHDPLFAPLREKPGFRQLLR